LREAISKLDPGKLFLEIGFGSGKNLLVAAKKFNIVLGTEVLPLKNFPSELSCKIEVVRADKATCFREAIFDVVAFNPPYLPSEQIEDRSVDGGLHGVEVPLEFLNSALQVLKREGKILILLSSLGDMNLFAKFCSDHRLIAKKLVEKKFFFETLTVYLVTPSETLAP
jgi:release factor glutamine methyltransferase